MVFYGPMETTTIFTHVLHQLTHTCFSIALCWVIHLVKSRNSSFQSKVCQSHVIEVQHINESPSRLKKVSFVLSGQDF